MKKEIILKGKEFILRPYKKEDFLSLVKNAGNKTIFKNFITNSISLNIEKEAKNFINASIVEKANNNSHNDFVINVDGLAVGVIGGYFKKNNEPLIFTFGYWLGEKYWNRGIISESIKLYTNYLFKTTKDLQRIEASVFIWNDASKKVLEKNGFKLEGILRKNRKYRGKLIDEYIFSKLRNESR